MRGGGQRVCLFGFGFNKNKFKKNTRLILLIPYICKENYDFAKKDVFKLTVWLFHLYFQVSLGFLSITSKGNESPRVLHALAPCSIVNTREEWRRIRYYTCLKHEHPHPPLQSLEADEHLQRRLRLPEDLNSLWKHVPFSAELANAPNLGATVRCQYFGGYWHNSVIVSPGQKDWQLC